MTTTLRFKLTLAALGVFTLAAAFAASRGAYGYRVLREDGNPSNTFILGTDGWLAVESELAEGDSAVRGSAAAIAMFAHVTDLLSAKGIKLVVALIPGKTRLYPQAFFPGDALLEPQASEYNRTIQALRDNGVFAPDLATAMLASPKLDQGLYFRGDSHWNQTGASVASQAIAAYANAKGLLTGVKREKFNLVKDGPPRPMPIDIPGKDLRLNGVLLDTAAKKRLGILPPSGATYQLLRAEGSGGAGLFGPPPQVVLIGTSFSAEADKHGFAEVLQAALGARVANVSIPGGGLTRAATGYFLDASFTKTPPKLIIWETPEYLFRTAETQAQELAADAGPWIMNDCPTTGIHAADGAVSVDGAVAYVNLPRASLGGPAYVHFSAAAPGANVLQVWLDVGNGAATGPRLSVHGAGDETQKDYNILLPPGVNLRGLEVHAPNAIRPLIVQSVAVCPAP